MPSRHAGEVVRRLRFQLALLAAGAGVLRRVRVGAVPSGVAPMTSNRDFEVPVFDPLQWDDFNSCADRLPPAPGRRLRSRPGDGVALGTRARRGQVGRNVDLDRVGRHHRRDARARNSPPSINGRWCVSAASRPRNWRQLQQENLYCSSRSMHIERRTIANSFVFRNSYGSDTPCSLSH